MEIMIIQPGQRQLASNLEMESKLSWTVLGDHLILGLLIYPIACDDGMSSKIDGIFCYNLLFIHSLTVIIFLEILSKNIHILKVL